MNNGEVFDVIQVSPMPPQARAKSKWHRHLSTGTQTLARVRLLYSTLPHPSLAIDPVSIMQECIDKCQFRGERQEVNPLQGVSAHAHLQLSAT